MKCKTEGCTNDSKAKGYCRKCYDRNIRYQKRKLKYDAITTNVECQCKTKDCSNIIFSKGYCKKCYGKIYRLKGKVA